MTNKSVIFSFLLLFLGYSLYVGLPQLIFYFDQTKGIAEIKSIHENKLRFSYFHENKKNEFSLSKKIPYIKDQQVLKKSKTWEIIYSKTFPKMVLLKNINPTPGLLPPIIWLGIAILPLIFFKNIGWKENQ